MDIEVFSKYLTGNVPSSLAPPPSTLATVASDLRTRLPAGSSAAAAAEFSARSVRASAADGVCAPRGPL